MSATLDNVRWGTGWFPASYEPTKTVHVLPNGDIRPHYFINCHCVPSVDCEVVTHRSFDGREDFESGYRKPS